MSRTIEPFTEPTSETVAPAMQMRADLPGDLAAGADRNAHDHEIGAFNRCRIGLDHLIGEPELGHAPARLRRARRRHNRAHQPCARAARAIEEPIRPTPIRARRLKSGAFRDHGFFPKNSASAATTSRFASSLPTVMRSAFGR